MGQGIFISLAPFLYTGFKEKNDPCPFGNGPVLVDRVY